MSEASGGYVVGVLCVCGSVDGDVCGELVQIWGDGAMEGVLLCMCVWMGEGVGWFSGE